MFFRNTPPLLQWKELFWMIGGGISGKLFLGIILSIFLSKFLLRKIPERILRNF